MHIKAEKKFKNIIWEGRFQPIHRGHVAYIRTLLEMGENVIVYVVANEQSNSVFSNIDDMPVPEFSKIVDPHHVPEKNPLPFWLRLEIVTKTVLDEFGKDAPIVVWGGRRFDLDWPLYKKLLPPERVFLTPEKDSFEDAKAAAWEKLGENVVRINIDHLPKISATLLRDRVKRGSDVFDLLCPKTEKLLKSYGYYDSLGTSANVGNEMYEEALSDYLHWLERIKTGNNSLNHPNRKRCIQQFAKENVMLWKCNPEKEYMSRQEIIENFNASISNSILLLEQVNTHFKSNADKALNDNYQIFLSAGLSGELAYFVYDKTTWKSFILDTLKRLHLANVSIISDYKIAFVGTNDPRHTLTRTALCFPERQRGIFGLQQPYKSFLDDVSKFQPDVLYGFSTAILLLAKAQKDGFLKIKPKTILANTDMISEQDKELIRQVWDKEVFNSYASTEGGIIGFECSQHVMHLNEDHIIVENDEIGTKITNLINKVQPIVEYRIPEKLTIDESPCVCGLPYKKLQVFGGRTHEIQYLKDKSDNNVPLHPIVIRSIVDTISGVISSHLQVSGSKILIDINGENYDAAQIKDRLYKHLQNENIDINNYELVIR